MASYGTISEETPLPVSATTLETEPPPPLAPWWLLAVALGAWVVGLVLRAT